jgi:WD40 repeat protein/energy-coupling factor transporter ATP-binding protein EcfA2
MSDFPYPGLRPFHRHETDIFFGREAATDQLIEKLGQTRFMAVVGPSGCGKSSLVRTGLLAGLEAGFLATAGVHWRIAELRPGNHPFARLAEALLVDKALGPEYTPPFAELPEATAFLHAQLRRGPLSLVEVLRETTLPEQTNLLIVVDQFEEIFRYYYQGAANEAAAFVALLLTSSQLSARPIQVYVVITMRSDFIGDCALFYDLPEAINQGLFLTPRLTREQLREAIEAPANVFDGEIESSLINRLLNDAGNDPDQLPLLQHALMRMWHLAQAENSPTMVLTIQHYEAIGGLAEALSRHADEAYAELNPLEQKIAEILFCNLTDRSKGLQYTRRPVPLEAVALQANVSWQQVAQVVEIFRQPSRNFLTPVVGSPLTPESILDISHESLIRQWQRLNQWTKAEAEAAELYQRLEDSARRWQEQRAELWSGIELEIALTWRQQHQPTANWAKRYGEADGQYFDLAMQFLDNSKAKQQEELKQAELARQRQAKQELHQAKLKAKALLAGKTATWAVLGLIIAITLALWGYWERDKALLAKQQAAQSESARTHSLFELQLTHAALLARDEDYAAAKVILKATRELDNQIPIGRRYARNLVAWFCELRGEAPQQIYEGAGAQLLTVAVSPDGQTLAAAGEKGTLVLFDVATGRPRQYLQRHSKSVLAALFHPQQPWLISADKDQRIIIWSLPTGKPILEWQTPYQINALALSPDGTQLASGGTDNHITLWDSRTGQIWKEFKMEGKAVDINDLAFDPQGRWLVSATSDNTATLWDLVNLKKIRTFNGHTSEIWGVTFDSTGMFLATSSDDKSIRLWNVATGETLRVLRGHQNTVFKAYFIDIDNGHYLISASQDRTLRIWDTDSGTNLRVLQGHTAGVTGLATWKNSIFSSSNDGQIMRWQAILPDQTVVKLPNEPASTAIAPDGKHVAVGFANGTLQWYSLPAVQLRWKNKQAHAKDIQRLNFNSTGNLLASASFDNTAKLWQVSENQLTEQQVFKGHQDAIYALAFSPDSRILATASYDSQFGLFTIGSYQQRFHKAHDGLLYSVNFDLSGTRLLTAGEDGYTRLWNIDKEPPVLLQTFPKAQDQVMWANFSPDNQQVATGGRDWLVHVYSVKDNQLRHRLIGHEQTILRTSFTPDAQQMVTVSGDATVRFWDLSNDRELFTLSLPTSSVEGSPLWDFDFRCMGQDCWIAVPLIQGKLVLYQLKAIYK